MKLKITEQMDFPTPNWMWQYSNFVLLQKVFECKKCEDKNSWLQYTQMATEYLRTRYGKK